MFKFLIDTNVLIGLEDNRIIDERFSNLTRLCAIYNIGIFVHSANVDDIQRDSRPDRREITTSKLSKYRKLDGIFERTKSELEADYGKIGSLNDHCDTRLLDALRIGVVDFVVTEDNGLLRRAERAGLRSQAMNVVEAVSWIKRSFDDLPVDLPFVIDKHAYEIDLRDPFFDSLRSDHDFDRWFREKCVAEHRKCWVLEVSGEFAGLVIWKYEDHSSASTSYIGKRILKLCTFKVSDKFRGERFGEQLLKKALWFAQNNSCDLIYLTAYPRQEALRSLLSYFGFEETKKKSDGEIFLEKRIFQKPPRLSSNLSVFDWMRIHYPRVRDDSAVRKFVIPIRQEYHKVLFPEIDFRNDLQQSLVDNLTAARTPGNTIRKIYLCRAKTMEIRSGDLLFFYESKGKGAGRQAITSVGVVEAVSDAQSFVDLVRRCGERSVFAAKELEALGASRDRPVKCIDFLLTRHLDEPVPLNRLISSGVFNRAPPQSIARLNIARYPQLKAQLNLGFEF